MSRPFDRYEYYLRSVQDPPSTVRFLERVYRERRGREPKVLGEDFSAAFAVSCEWVRRSPSRHAVCVDYDREPLDYGRNTYASQLPEAARKRLKPLCEDVRSPKLPHVDVIASLNFSYYGIHSRAELVAYFRNARRRLGSRGVFVLDAFGGPDTQKAVVDTEKYGDFVYYWEQTGFDPISHEATFFIHFKRRGEAKRERVFRYDWRMWTLPELKDVLREAGFRRVDVYWEGTDKKGGGNGFFRKRRRGDADLAWVAYLVAT